MIKYNKNDSDAEIIHMRSTRVRPSAKKSEQYHGRKYSRVGAG